ncbi:MAG: hypothetical protein KAR42_15065 [candidate division Zixibacteria bacterium]|nr:hypothetical protein [candidate division Zixibacteria bacterium]
MIWNKEKGCLLIGNKKYFKGNELPKGFTPSKKMLDEKHVVDNIQSSVDWEAKVKANIEVKAKEDAEAKAKADAEAKKDKKK